MYTKGINKLLIAIIAIAPMIFVGCKEGCTHTGADNYDPKAKKDDGTCEFTSKTINLKFEFNHMVGLDELFLDTIMYTNAAGNNYSIITLKYIISDIILHSSSGDVLIDDEHYVDITDSTTFEFEPTDNINNGTFTGISFTFGLDTVKNIDGYFVNPPESDMFWPGPMGGPSNAGYHYMKLEGKFDSASVGTIKNYNTHFGASMGTPYHFNVSLANSAFTAAGNDLEVHIDMDLNEWYTDPNTYDFNNYGTMIMGNTAAQQAIMENGATVFSLDEIH